MPWTTTRDLPTFLAAAGGFLWARPVANTVLLSVLASLESAGRGTYGGAPPEYGWWGSADGRTAGAFLRTPPWPVLLSEMPDEAAADLAGLPDDPGAPVTGANGGQAAARAYAAAWQRRTGRPVQPAGTHRLYRLAGLVPPDPSPPGRARTAGPADRALLVEWVGAFLRETSAPAGSAHGPAVDDRLSYGGLTLWETEDGPVSMAGRTRTIAGTTRITHVYTPPGRRGRGYAAAVTAAVSGPPRDAGIEVLLFADRDNRTTNALYQRLGYRALEDRLELSFGDRPDGGTGPHPGGGSGTGTR